MPTTPRKHCGRSFAGQTIGHLQVHALARLSRDVWMNDRYRCTCLLCNEPCEVRARYLHKAAENAACENCKPGGHRSGYVSADPTPEVIAERAAAIRAENMAGHRRNHDAQPVYVPKVYRSALRRFGR